MYRIQHFTNQIIIILLLEDSYSEKHWSRVKDINSTEKCLILVENENSTHSVGILLRVTCNDNKKKKNKRTKTSIIVWL